MAMTGYTASDQKVYGESCILFTNRDRTGNLRISCSQGTIDYWCAQSCERTRFPHDLPALQQLFKLTAALLPKIGIGPSELSTTEKGKPKFVVVESRPEYHVGNTNLTNMLARSVRFTRTLDGVELYGDGGEGEIQFGNHGLIEKFSISWRKLQRIKVYPAPTPRTVVKWLRENRATYEPATALEDIPTIDWPTVKQIEVNKARAFYWGHAYPAGKTMSSLGTLRPYAALLATVDTGGTNIEITIQCPLLDEGEVHTDSAKLPRAK
jgi:hypothetical protein